MTDTVVREAIEAACAQAGTQAGAPTINMAAVNGAHAEKKRPGRPRKTIENTPAEFRGVVTEPFNPEHIMEFVCCDAKSFKKLNSLHKGYAVNEVCISFRPNSVVMTANDRLNKSTVHISIDCSKLNHYYCRQDVTIWIKRESMDKIFAAFDKTRCKITFILKADYRSHFYIHIYDADYDSTDNYMVEVINQPDGVVWPNYDDSQYPLRFTLSGKYFKRKITDMGKISKTLTIIKDGDEPLQLTYEDTKMISYNSDYKNGEKISLMSRIAAGDILSVSVLIGYIKPFSNSNIGDRVTIAASKNEGDRLSLSTSLGATTQGSLIEVKVFVEIKTGRRT
jgi:hypothetical protein